MIEQYGIYILAYAFFIFAYQSAMYFYIGRVLGDTYVKIFNFVIFAGAIGLGYLLYSVGVGYIPLLVVIFLPKIVRLFTTGLIVVYSLIKIIALGMGLFGDVSRKLAEIAMKYHITYGTVRRTYDNNLTIEETVEELIEKRYIDADVEEVLDEIE
jgi:hypothetical protein